MFALVSPFNKTFDEVGLTYSVPDFLVGELQTGMIVEMPVRDSIEIAVVLEISQQADPKINPEKIKEIISIKNNFKFLNKLQITLLRWIPDYYFTAIHNSSTLFFPKNLRDKITKDKFDISKVKEKEYSFEHDYTLSQKQQGVYNDIKSSEINKMLLHGVTGSGKTEIYIKLIYDYISQDKQVLFLIPEIILNNQLADRLIKVFGSDVVVLNSSVSDAKKTQIWMDIYSGNTKIIIGTRSSLFYPYNNLGMIIIDEEHDNSYVSDNSPRYNALEVANKISELSNIPLLLASGTPSISSMYKALKGEYKLLSLLEVFNPD